MRISMKQHIQIVTSSAMISGKVYRLFMEAVRWLLRSSSLSSWKEGAIEVKGFVLNDKRGLLVIMLMGAWGNALAQNRPVTTTLQLMPPYSVYLADYARPGSEQMQVYLLLRDLSEAQYDVRLRLTIEGSGIRLQTNPTYIPPPITLEGGAPTLVSGEALAPYLESRNLLFSGITQAEYEQRRALPEGFYQFTVEVIDYRRADRVLSRPATFMAWFTLNEPPRLTAPLCGSALPLQEPTNILFQWIGGGNLTPGSAFSTEYELTLVEVFPAERNVDDAIRSSIPLLQTTTTETSYLYGITDAALIPGQKYAFRVRAVDTQGRDVFKNQGYSEVCSFTYGDGLALAPPDGIRVYAENARKALVNWHLSIEPDAYRVEYRRKANQDEEELNWFSQETTEEQVILRDLEPETTYEVRVASLFSNYVSRYSLLQTFTTPEVIVAACGAAPAAPITASTVPLTTAIAGQYWQVGDFRMQVRAVRGGNGVFSGWGVMSVPYLNVQIPVKFEGVWVNEDYNVVRGEVIALSEGLEGFQQRWQEEHSEQEETRHESGPVADGETDSENGPGDEAEMSSVTVAGEVTEVYVNEAGQVVAVDSEGNEEVVAEQTPQEGEALAVEDSQGNSFTVDSNGGVSSSNAPEGAPANNRAVDVEQELIKELLEYFKEEINTFLENKDKGPLEEALIRRLMAFPDCLPEEEAPLEAVLAKIEDYLEDTEVLLNLIKEDDANKARIEELTAKLVGQQPPYAAGLTETEWEELVEMICPYLLPEEEKQVQYTLPLTVYLDDDYYLSNPEKTEFADGDTITVESYMVGVTLLMKDAADQPVELLSSYFPEDAGEVWPPGFTISIEALEEGEAEEVEILIPELDTMLVYIEKYKPALEMNQVDILALLLDINEAQKDDKTNCDLSARLANYSTGDIAGELGKVKVNEKYEVQSLKLKLTHQSNTDISLEDVDVTIKEGAGKDEEIAVFAFSSTEDSKTMLELTVEKKDREFLEWYLLGKEPVFKITTTYIEDDDYTTVSSFTINRGDFSGYFLERPEGTAVQERTAGSYKRIPEGDYEMCYTYKQCRAATTRSNADNETWIKTYGETDNSGATITREYVLIHKGNYPWHSAGCLLIGDGYSDYTLEEDYNEYATGILYEKDLVVKMVSSSGDKLTALNNEYKKLIDLTKKFDDDCENNKCYELEIDINR